ncbi:MAG: hypothetical protein JOS17DRAFT_789726 [Linnemannia elongata]|nr:MAG: hypothetical protein JOS17DRAFT_789726 [Linnemannia elongata]
MTSIASLPQEILDLIVNQLTRTHLTIAVLVNKTWFTTFTPSLWRELSIVNRTINDYLRTPESRTAFIRNSLYIRVVETTDPELAVFLAFQHPSITNLSSLTLRLRGQPTTSITEIVPATDVVAAVEKAVEAVDGYGNALAVVQMVKMNRELRVLRLEEGCFWEKDGRTNMFLEIVSAISSTYLEKLELSFLPHDWAKSYYSSSNHIKDAENREQSIGLQEAMNVQHSKEPFSALKELSLTGAYKGTTDPAWLAFLVRCPEVERIRLDRLDVMMMDTLPALLRATCPKLRRLDWTNCYLNSDESIADLLRGSKLGWRELHLSFMYWFGHRAYSALMESAEMLEVLHVEGTELGKNAVLDLLCSAKNLRRLEGVKDGRRETYTKEFAVHAQEAFLERVDGGSGNEGRSWAVGPLVEFFQLRIEGVPRPDVLYRQSGLPLGNRQEGLEPSLRYNVQEWIYTQLSRMTNLRELILGQSDFNPEVFSDYGLGEEEVKNPVLLEEGLLKKGRIFAFHYLSLEFSLESGLGLLSELKELRVLDVRMTAHNIGVEELEWMHRNWPKLKKIRGLETERGWSVDRDDGFGARAGVEEWMAAHPRGIGSSFYR